MTSPINQRSERIKRELAMEALLTAPVIIDKSPAQLAADNFAARRLAAQGRESDRQLVAGWWIIPAAIIGLALIVAAAAWVALRLPLDLVVALFTGVMIVCMAAVVAIAFLLGPQY